MARSLTVAHDKVKGFAWEPTLVPNRAFYPTKYRIPPRTKDPFRHLLCDYFAMEEEKDNRQYGALEDVIARSRSPQQAQPRWMEVLKPLLGIVCFGEYAAMKCMAMLVDAVDNPELRQGYLAQMLDEVRHVNQEDYLLRYLARHAPDPAGFNSALRARAYDPICRAGRAVFETFVSGDPIACALNLQVVAEAGYTNSVFVAVTEIAAVNGDPATPSVFLSVQSDEARHMANGYATLAAVLAEPENLPLLQQDFDAAFWRQHVFLDNFLGAVYDYFPKIRLKSYREYWEQWVWEDWVGSYIERLSPFGLQTPRWAEQARFDVQWGGHTIGMISHALWPIHHWRSDPLDDEDFEYLENHYPGWEAAYGDFWRAYREMTDPRDGALALQLFEQLPMFCRVCHMPAVLPRPDIADTRLLIDADGRRHAFCSEACETIYRSEPHRYQARTWWELYDGMDLAEYIEMAGLVRADGKTLVPQPHLRTDEEWLWTIDDIRRQQIEIRDPLRAVPIGQLRTLE
jgi:hypothetical protein